MSAIEAELEAKFFDVNLTEIKQKLESIDAALESPQRLMRRVVYGGEANPSMVCTYGRVRDEGDKITMSAKYSAVNGDIASQKEAMVVVDSFESAVSILDSFGLTRTNFQESKRETWKLQDGTLVELEEWPDLPTYIEIEGDSVEAVKAAAAALALDWNSHTTDSTDKLYAKHHGLSAEQAQAMMADLHF